MPMPSDSALCTTSPWQMYVASGLEAESTILLTTSALCRLGLSTDESCTNLLVQSRYDAWVKRVETDGVVASPFVKQNRAHVTVSSWHSRGLHIKTLKYMPCPLFAMLWTSRTQEPKNPEPKNLELKNSRTQELIENNRKYSATLAAE